LKSLIALVACCGAIFWAWRVVRESGPIPRMASKLRTGSVEDRRLAARDLGVLPPTEVGAAIPTLIAALGDDDSEVAVQAAQSLGADAMTATSLKDGQPAVTAASQALARALADRRPEVRAAAAGALGVIGIKVESAPPPGLIAALRDDPSAEVRAEAAAAVGQYRGGDEDAIRGLFDGLVDEAVSVRRACNAALARPQLSPAPALIPYLIRALREGRDARARYRAAALLGRLGPAGREAVPALIASLQEPPGARPASLQDRPLGRLAAAGKIQVGPLEQAPQDWDPACAAARALGAIARGGTESSAAVVAALSAMLHSEHAWRRGAAAEALMPMGKEAAAAGAALARALTEAAATAAAAAPAPDESGPGSWIARALGQVAPGSDSAAEAIRALTAALAAKDEETRGWAADSLGRFGPAAAAAVPRLRELLRDPSPLVSRLARTALSRIDPSFQPPAKSARSGER
jgi:HEAT repeat protein